MDMPSMEPTKSGGLSLRNQSSQVMVCEICESNYTPFFKTKIGIICQTCKRVMDNELVLLKVRALVK